MDRNKRVFLLGAGGYIGGSVAKKLANNDYNVFGLIRRESDGEKLKKLNIHPVIGNANYLSLIQEQCRQSDIVINVADSDNPFLVETILKSLENTNKTFVHTSGSSIVSTRANGNKVDTVFDETTKFEPAIEKKARVMINDYVISFAQKGVRTIVICPAMVYGQSVGIKSGSNKLQLTTLIELAKEKGKALHIGKGENIWSNVHIADLAELYLLAIEKAPAGSFFFAENGECSFKSITDAISQKFGLGKPESWDIDDAIERWGASAALFAFGSNSRVSAKRAKQLLGWQPRQMSLINEIESISP